ncbi:hypothetical protein [Opitutus sp. GAS368]|jgi:hypothetical protein|uniref:hypothetical protein n=1 Tax=Opitutus sp. GAS368 TaxID=1882749 RepID=UPI00087D8CF8|nr:hypothetical protein [Opitutus sp. GAS368]SDS32701.1 hypothetical protein SAMN05444173_2560 [Opitutus sp. GAS368]
MKFIRLTAVLLLAATAFAAGCSKPAPVSAAAAKPPKHEHKPPHGGTPVVLGDEVYHVELVLDAAAGRLQAFVFDGELENFIRSAVPTIQIDAVVNGQAKTVVLSAVANPATGETVGDTSLFEGQADWLKTTREFDATLKTITVRGTTFADVKFNFPKGNDKD